MDDIAIRQTAIRNWKPWIVTGCVISLVLAVATIPVLRLLRTAHLMQAHNNLKMIGLALHEYHDQYGSFPPPVVVDDKGNHIQSWRSMIIPYLASQGDASQYFSGYDFSQPWNSNHNLEFARQHRYLTRDFSVLAVVGPGAMWSKNGPTRLKDNTGGTSNTALAIGIEHAGVEWTEPRDLSWDGNKLWLDAGNGQLQPVKLSAVFLLMADGSVRYCQNELSPDAIKSLITKSAGDTVPEF